MPDLGQWADKQLSKEQAIAMAESELWKEWTPEQVVRFQLFQELLCVSFAHFHKCIEEVLCRPVFTHEFASRDDIVKEYLGVKETPQLEEIIGLIPEDKRLIIGV